MRKEKWTDRLTSSRTGTGTVNVLISILILTIIQDMYTFNYFNYWYAVIRSYMSVWDPRVHEILDKPWTRSQQGLMMTENSRNLQPRNIAVLYNKLVCMIDNKVVCISKAHRDDICKNSKLMYWPTKALRETP